jgi:hypothetical protein
MKNALIIPLAVAVMFMSCKKDESKEVDVIEEEVVELSYDSIQNAIIQDFTSTGCPGCGSWGVPTFEQFIKNNPTVVPVSVHIKYNDPMITQESNDLGNNRVGRKWTPQLAIGNEQCVLLTNSNSIDGQGSVAKMNAEFASLTSMAPVVAADAKYKIEEGKVTVNYGSKSLENLTGEYFISTLLMEDSIVYKQSNASQNFVHNYVIRESVDNVFGTAIPAAKLNKGEIHELEATFEVDNSWRESKLYVIVLVWKKNGGIYEFINASTGDKI